MLFQPPVQPRPCGTLGMHLGRGLLSCPARVQCAISSVQQTTSPTCNTILKCHPLTEATEVTVQEGTNRSGVPVHAR
jgi:hypothetical protein